MQESNKANSKQMNKIRKPKSNKKIRKIVKVKLIKKETFQQEKAKRKKYE